MPLDLGLLVRKKQPIAQLSSLQYLCFGSLAQRVFVKGFYMGRRDDIIAAGLAIISEQGPRGLTLPAIFNKVGTGSGTFYHYFNGVDDLIQEMLRYCCVISEAALEPIQQSSLPVKDRFFECVALIFKAYVNYPNEMKFLYWYAYGYVLHIDEDEVVIPSLNQLVRILEEAQEQHLVATGVAPLVEARMVRGLIASAVWGNDRDMFADDEKSLHVFTKACWRFVGGLES